MRCILLLAVCPYSLILLAFVAHGCQRVDGGYDQSAMEWPTGTDAGAITADSGTASEVASGDAVIISRTDAWSASVRSIRGLELAAETCDDESLTLPDGFVQSGETAWHLCYATPTVETSVNPYAEQVSESVSFTVRSLLNDEAQDVIRIQPRIAEIGWIASIVLIMPDPPVAYPLFNARNIYDAHIDGVDVPFKVWAVQASADGHTLETHGVLRIWRVLSDGRRQFASWLLVANNCNDEAVPILHHGGSFWPNQGYCPLRDEICPSEVFACR